MDQDGNRAWREVTEHDQSGEKVAEIAGDAGRPAVDAGDVKAIPAAAMSGSSTSARRPACGPQWMTRANTAVTTATATASGVNSSNERLAGVEPAAVELAHTGQGRMLNHAAGNERQHQGRGDARPAVHGRPRKTADRTACRLIRSAPRTSVAERPAHDPRVAIVAAVPGKRLLVPELVRRRAVRQFQQQRGADVVGAVGRADRSAEDEAVGV